MIGIYIGCICDLVLSSLKIFHYYAFLNADHAVRINIHNKTSKEREWISEFKFISEHRKFSHGVAANSKEDNRVRD